MSWQDEYLNYLDPEGNIRNNLDALGSMVQMDPEESSPKLKNLYKTIMDVVSVPKRISDIAIHEAGPEVGPIRPSQETLQDALFPSTPSAPLVPEEYRPLIEEIPGGSLLTAGDRLQEAGKYYPNVEKVGRGLGRGVTGLAGGLATDPLTPALAGEGAIGKIATGAFLPVMAESAGLEAGTSIALGKDQGDLAGAIEHGTAAVGSAGLAGLTAAHLKRSATPVLSRAAPEILTRPIVYQAPEDIGLAKEPFNVNDNLLPDSSINGLGSNEAVPGVGPTVGSVVEDTPTRYLEIKPLLDEAYRRLPFEYDPTRIGMGGGGFKGKSNPPEASPYGNLENEIEGLLGDEVEVPSSPSTPISQEAPKNLPLVPKNSLEEAINARAKEIRSQVKDIDPVRARKLAKAEIEASSKPESTLETTPSEEPSIPETPKRNLPIIPKEPEIAEVKKSNKYRVTLEDGSVHEFKGPSEEAVVKFAEDKLGKVSSIEQRLPGRAKKASTVVNKEPVKSQVNPTETSLFDDMTDLPKTLKSAFDLSYGGRQNYFLLNRSVARKATTRGYKSALGTEYHENVKSDLASRPNAELYKKFGLNQIEYDPTSPTAISEQHPLTSRRANTKFAEVVQNIPGLKQTERAFTDPGNLARADMFDYFADKWNKSGFTPENRPDLFHATAKYLNVLTGRLPLPEKLRQAGYILNKGFWSPQWVWSRMQILNPGFYYKLPKELRMDAIRDIGGTLAVTTGVLASIGYAAKEAGVKDVEFDTNPTSTNFLKLKVGKTNYDFFTGIAQIIRTASRIATSRKKTLNGEYHLKGGFNLGSRFFDTPTDRLREAPFGSNTFSELGNFVEGKAAPAYQIGKGVLSGENYYHEPYGLPDIASDIAAPMSLSDIYTAYKDYGAKEGLKNIPSIFGIGVQTEHLKNNKVSGSSRSGRSSGRKRKHNW